MSLHLGPLLDGGGVVGGGRVEVVLLHGPTEPAGDVGAAPVSGVCGENIRVIHLLGFRVVACDSYSIAADEKEDTDWGSA